MLNDAAGFKRIFIAAGYTDLRRGIDGLAGIVQYQFELDFLMNIFISFTVRKQLNFRRLHLRIYLVVMHL